MIKYKGMLPKSSTEDLVILVDFLDRKIGEMDKLEAHLGEGKRHRAISVFLFNSKGELLLQQRSEKKIVGALQWANTCCGNVRPNETRKACALRRLREELGIVDVKLSSRFTFEYHVKCNGNFSEWEIDKVFTGIYDGDVLPNPNEVKNIDWINPNEIKLNTDKYPERYVPWLKIILDSGKLNEFNR